jgi:phospholipase/carboxylesterase
MNRITLRPAVQPSPQTQTPYIVEHGLFRQSTDSEFEHSLFVPMHCEPKYAYPLVIWLHGHADDHRQLLRVMPMISLRNYLAIAPTAPKPFANAATRYWAQTDAAVMHAEDLVDRCVEQVWSRFKIHPQRIYLAGVGAGGTMALRIGLSQASRLAGVMSLNGALPSCQAPLSNLVQSRKLPLFIGHSRQSSGFAEEQLCDELRLLHSGGFSVTLRQYPGSEDLNPSMLQDLDRWMMESINGYRQ